MKRPPPRETLRGVPAAKTINDIETLLRAKVIGRSVRVLEIYGINSLKTVQPPLSSLNGQLITDAVATPDRTVALLLGEFEVQIDLQRTGHVEWTALGDGWTPSSGVSMPTGRLILADATSIDFREPARTKRITFRVHRCGNDSVGWDR